MKHHLLSFFLFLSILSSFAARKDIPLLHNWKFVQEDIAKASAATYDDSQWRSVTIPHDWAFEVGPMRSGAQGGPGGYYTGGIGWYRKEFEVQNEWLDKSVSINFDGVYMNSEVWINGHYLGKRPYGYTPFCYELSKYLKKGKNTLAVKVDNSLEPSARWYHPCGIYSHVRLIVKEKLSIARHGVFVHTSINKSIATAIIETRFDKLAPTNADKSKLELKSFLYTSDEKKVGEAIGIIRNSEETVKQEISLKNPQLWDVDNPSMYKIVSQLYSGGKLIDEEVTPFGFRDIAWKPSTGFWINGKNTKLLGVCEHWEAGPFGGAWTKEWMSWKLKLLKSMGTNAIRTAHNTCPPFFYDLCDSLGILVMDEFFDGWHRKAKQDYGKQAFKQWWKKDLKEIIFRNRNHPCIIIYSVGNETRGNEINWKKEVALLDNTRLVTSGSSYTGNMSVVGMNGHSEYESFFKKGQPSPSKAFVSTEAPHTWQTRGYYRTKTWYRDGFKPHASFKIPDLTTEELFHYEWAHPSKFQNGKQHYNSSYDNGTVRINARQAWEKMRDIPWLSGQFRWTGFDYWGEASYVHGGWPFRLFMGGALDVAGFKKDLYYFYQSQWTEKPMVHLLPQWTHPKLKKGTKIPVWAYSNCDEVELFLNGKSLGKDKPKTNWKEMQCEWLVPWTEGTLKAVGYSKGKKVVETSLSSAKQPAKVRLTVDDMFTEKGIAIITAATTDKDNNIYPYGENKVYYHFDENIRLRSLENGSPVDSNDNVSFNHRAAFMGLTRAFIEYEGDEKKTTLTAGSILGEKQLLTSKLVAIDVKSINLVGQPVSKSFDIYYTLDGSTPSKKSKKYEGTFEVSLGTTVKALVLEKGKEILMMEERFDKGLGLCWEEGRNEGSALFSNTASEAENATIVGANKTIEGEKFYGKGFVDFAGKEGSIKWYQENDGTAKTVNMSIRYAHNDSNGTRPMKVIVNNKEIQTLNFKPTGSWNKQWSKVSFKAKIVEGANYIELKTTGKSGPNIDHLDIQ